MKPSNATRPFIAMALVAAAAVASTAQAQDTGHIDDSSAAIEEKVIQWRRDIHEHPELGNRETRTAGLVAEHLKSLGYQVTENVAATGVVGVLEGGKPGPVVALRADMDALPVEERSGLTFASTARTQWNGQEVWLCMPADMTPIPRS